MVKDEDMFIVIVGDENANNTPAAIQIKQETLDENEVEQVIDYIKNSEGVQRLQALDKPFVKEEILGTEDSNEYLSEISSSFEFNENINFNYEDDDDDGDKYFPDDFIEAPVNGLCVTISNDISSEESEKKNVRRNKFLKPSQRYSYVKELQNQFPNLKDDSYLLITTLAETMKNTKPPPPPQDYYIMNGIMLECVHCGHHSQSIMAAGRHYQEKHGERYLFCYSCGVNFRSTTNLYKHEKRCEAPDAAVVLRARALALGRKGRSRPYIPTITDDKPKNKTNLYKHKKSSSRAVTDDKPRKFECSECSASFISKIGLRAHLLTHRGERPHRCHVCAAAYTSISSLARHLKKHSDVEYICDHCKRSFKVKGALVEHMYTHRPEKRFGCAECPKRFAQKMALDLHVMQKHRNLPPPFACRLCPHRCRRMSILKEHMKKMHGMMIMTRKMFFKKLPTLSTPQINQAKLVFKDVVDNQNSYFITQCRKTQS